MWVHRSTKAATVGALLLSALLSLPSSVAAAGDPAVSVRPVAVADDEEAAEVPAEPSTSEGDAASEEGEQPHDATAVTISSLSRSPTLDDFADMRPPAGLSGMTRIDGFVQQQPSDGEPASQQTHVYLGYDDERLHVVFAAFDASPDGIRARMTRRENIDADDVVEVMLDTFRDRRRAYAFRANPYGIQWDATWTEGQGYDDSFDTVWKSTGRLTDRGYVVHMSIPFKSLRFPSSPRQTWGIILSRQIARGREEVVFWPRVSNRIEGRLNQAGTIGGIVDVSPGNNLQLIPYGTFRSFKALDTRSAGSPRFVTDLSDPAVGLDAKMVIDDSLVLDATANPDFSQVESDEPQVTANRRFEVFFPEKRPFFLENADFFATPLNLLFTRRIADPRLGVRLTGKAGPWSVGTMLIDDESAGARRSPEDPLHDDRARYGVVRVSRDVFDQSSIGAIYVDRSFDVASNRVGGVDGRFKLSDNWVTRVQAVTSSTRFLDGRQISGPAYDVRLARSGRQFNYFLQYRDIDPDFRAQTGFVPRVDVRRVNQNVNYSFRPEGDFLISVRPGLWVSQIWDHDGLRLDRDVNPWINIEITGGTWLNAWYVAGRERLRPADFSSLTTPRDFDRDHWGLYFRTGFHEAFSMETSWSWGDGINFVPPAGRPPSATDTANGRIELTLRPANSLRIDNTYLFNRASVPDRDDRIFSNHIVRTRWNWQFSRELSLRVILQYEALTPDPRLSALPDRRNVNADFLITYQLDPWTSLYVGYNGNAQNLDLLPTDEGIGLVRTGDRLVNDANQFFVKFSYLLRF